VIECDPAVSDVVEKVAWLEEFTDAVPMVPAPSLKFTVPEVGPSPPEPVPPPQVVLLATVAVKVTDCPTHDGLTLDATLVVVFALLTNFDTVVVELRGRLLTPLVFAVTLAVNVTLAAAVVSR
jgi:hypothetical protein